MNLIFDLDDTLYDLMGPFELVHKKLYADKTDADCTELFIKSRDYSDEIMEAEIKGDIPHEDCFYERIKRTYHDVGIEMNREDTEELSNLQADIQKTINAKKSDWIMNGFTDADWDEYLKSLDSYGLEDYLKIYQKYLDAYYAEQK